MPVQQRIARTIQQVLAVAALLVLFGAAAGYLLVRYLLWPQADRLRPQIVAAVSQSLGRPLAVGRVQTGWSGLHPRLTLHEVRLGDALALPEVQATLSWRSLLMGQPRFALLRLVGARVDVERDGQGRWQVAGLPLASEALDDRPALRWLLAQRRVELADARLRLRDALAPATQAGAVEIDGVHAAIQNVGRSHRFVLQAAGVSSGAVAAVLAPPSPAPAPAPTTAPAQDGPTSGQADAPPARARLAGALELRGDFAHPAHVPASSVERWRGALYLKAGELELARLMPRLAALGALPAGTPWATALPAAGQVSLAAWIDRDRGRLTGGTLKLGATDLRLTPAHDELHLPRLRLDARLSGDDDGYLLELTDADASEAGGARLSVVDRPARLWLDPTGRPLELSARIEELDLAAALALARKLPLPAALAEPMADADTGGRLSALQVDWKAPRSGAERSRYAVSAGFEQLSIAAGTPGRAGALGRPGASGLSGRLSANQSGGEMTLDSGRSALTFPGVFAEPAVPLERLAGRVSWSVGQGPAQPDLAVGIERLSFANADASGELEGSWRSGGKGLGVIDLQGRLTEANATRTARYLPLSLPQGVRDWVGRAVTAGRSDRVEFRVRGDLKDFPYRDPAAGDFRIRAALRDGALAYAPGWPAIEQVRGELLFERAGMRISADAARVYGVRLGDVRATIPDYRTGLVQIEGTGVGPAQDMLRFVNDSPVRASIDDFTLDVQASGDAALQLALEVPMGRPEATRVDGTVRFAGNDVVLDRTLPRFERVSGRLQFGDAGFALRDLTSTFLGGPIRVTGETIEPGRLRIRAGGTVGADGMRRVIDNPLTRRLSGEMRYAATIDVRRRASSVRVESDLVGLAVDLPAPFGKAAAEALPLRVDAVPTPPFDARSRPAGDLLSAQLGESIRVAFERARDHTDRLRIRRGAFAIRGEPVLPESGLSVLLDLPRLDLDAWHAILGDAQLVERAGASDEFADGFTLLPGTVSVVADELRVAGKELHRVVLGASRTGAQWRANVSAREIDGFFNWREAGPGQPMGTLTARFARLRIPQSSAEAVESLLDADPQRLPALDIAAEAFTIGDTPLGALTLLASNGGSAANPMWSLERLVLAAPEARLEASGRWARRPGARERSTDLKFDLAITDAGALLERFGVRGAIAGGEGRLAGELGWAGAPQAIDYPSLGGRLQLDLGQGQFLKVDPGIAKLIGVVNLQSLPRRLALDFRDVFSEGFAFDRIEGDVAVERGVARTDDLRMQGVQAVVSIRGSADLERETQDLRVRVVPELNAGLASLAYAALANPAIGLGSFIAQWVLRKPLQQAFAYDVDVKGSWTDPQVKPVGREPLAPPVP